jgi:Family of unknown function (DUF5941)
VRSRLVRRPRRRASPDGGRPPGDGPGAAPAAQSYPAGPEYDGGEYARWRHTAPDESEPDGGGPAYWVPGYAGSGEVAPDEARRDGEAEDGDASGAAYPEAEHGKLITIGLPPNNGRIALAGSTPDLMDGQPDLTLRETGLLAEAGRLALAWATERRLSRSTACGITLALAACAAAWFSAGTRTDVIRGAAALWTGYLVLRAGQRLPAGRSPAAAVDWLTALGSCLAECVVYAGLAAGTAAEHWSRAWPLAIAVLGVVGVRNLMSVCSVPPGFGEHSDGPIRRVGSAALTMPLGGRIGVLGLVAPVWGPRVALLALLAWAIVAICCGLAGRAAPGVTDDSQRPSARSSLLLRLRDDGALARGLGALVRGNLLPLPPALLGLSAISALALLGLRGLPWPLMIAPAVVMLLAAPGSAHPHTGRLDWLVPALLLGAQILYLTAIGLGAGVPGPVIFVLGAALLMRYADLACPGRPVMLGKTRSPDSAAGERGAALGWEGRLLIAGLAAAMGIATFAYLALTVYFGFLICVKVVTSFVARQEELTRDRLGAGRRRKPSAAS